jgi:hypothetical protein
MKLTATNKLMMKELKKKRIKLILLYYKMKDITNIL